LFFILSGFLFWWVTAGQEGAAARFMLRRSARLVPLYWLVTLTVFVASWVGLSHRVPFAAGDLWQSLLFIPHTDARTGLIVPVLQPGWILDYEFPFCVVFSLGLLLREGLRIWALTLLLGSLVVVGVLFHPTNPVLATYTRPLLLEFLAGIWLARTWRRHTLPIWLCGVLLGVGVVASFGLPAVRPQDVPAIVTAGPSAFLCVVGGMGLERAHWPEIRWLKRIGDASYSIFLWHIPVIVGMTLVLGRLGVRDGLVSVTATIPACVVVGMVLYQLLERPITQWLFGLIDIRVTSGAPVRQATV
jgi:exopolysaccharide production protein ExoZ